MTLNLGLRYDTYWAWVSDTDIPAGRFGAARHYDKTDHLLSFNDINPRIGAAYDLFVTGRRSERVCSAGTWSGGARALEMPIPRLRLS